jgi:D-apiose dehydrogenase
MVPLRIAVIGCGFWSRFQIPAWHEIEGVTCVAVCDRDKDRSRTIAAQSNIPLCYQEPVKMLQAIRPDVVDIVTGPETHRELVDMASDLGVPVICQKPMAIDFASAEDMVRLCGERKVPFFVHENWRWQKPIRELKSTLASGVIGQPFRARIDFNCSFPVFDNQPSLRSTPELIVADLGVHLLDATRFLFGEAVCVSCLTQQITPNIAGEDVATVLLGMANGMTVCCNLSFATRLEFDRFPETSILVEGAQRSAQLTSDYWIKTTDGGETWGKRFPPIPYPWADPNYAIVHDSIVECHRNLAAALTGTAEGETSGADNLKTLKLVFASYKSARSKRTIQLGSTIA